MKVYMEVTQDEYSLPICMTYSVSNLAYISNTPRGTIDTSLSRFRKGETRFPRFIEVEIDWKDE